MANSGSRKQITFDLCQEALKKYYPHSLTQAYYDIRRFMESHGFEHRQSSAYVSLDKMMTLDVVSLAEQLAMALPWLSRCVNEIDVDVDENPKAYYFEQARNGVFARQAIICKALGLR